MALRLKTLLRVGMLSLCAATATAAPVKDYPAEPVRIIVPFPPGAGVDIVTRLVAAKQDGRVFDRHVSNALGSLEHPMSDSDLENKFRALTKHILPDDQAAKLIDACWNVAQLDDAGNIARLASARAEPSTESRQL